MRYLVLVAALAACEKKPAKPRSIDSIDRGCKADGDCVLTGHLGCCDTSCGKDVGVSVNAKAWYAAASRFREDCNEDCHVMCEMLPDCRDEAIAVCTSGVCDIATRKTAACEAESLTACTTTADCEVVTEGAD